MKINWKLLWGFLMTALVIAQFFFIGSLSKRLADSDTTLKAYDSELLYKQSLELFDWARKLHWRQKFIERYLNHITKDDYNKNLKNQGLHIYNEDEELKNEKR